MKLEVAARDLGDGVVEPRHIVEVLCAVCEDPVSERAAVIASYALCGFANFGSIAIQIGGIGSLAPERRQDLARIGFFAMIAGSLAAFMTAAVVGVLI